jgi:predicted transport protein
MLLYKKLGNVLKPVKNLWFNLEKDMQSICEQNLKELFGLDFVATEFSLNNLRIDTLAYDSELESFVVIEYKRWSSYSVIDQGFSYLSLILNNKAEFILKYNHVFGKNFWRDNFDWSAVKVIFVADSFTRYQQDAINFKDLPIELWECKLFSEDIFVLNPIISANPTESIKTVSQLSPEMKEVQKEVYTYTLEKLIKPDWNESREMFEEVRKFVQSLDPNLQEKINKWYVGYKNKFQNLIWVNIYKSYLNLAFPCLKKSDLNDFENKLVDEPTGRWWVRCDLKVLSKEDLPYAFLMIQQAYQKYNT